MLARKAPFRGGLRRGLPQEVRQAGEVRLAVEDEGVGLLVREHVLGELRAQRREPLRDRGEPRLRLGPELRALGLDA